MVSTFRKKMLVGKKNYTLGQLDWVELFPVGPHYKGAFFVVDSRPLVSLADFEIG